MSAPTLEFRKSTESIDGKHPGVLAKSAQLSYGSTSALETAGRRFEWVRDSTPQSSEFRRDLVTCSASQALAEGTGYCHAESGLLAGLGFHATWDDMYHLPDWEFPTLNGAATQGAGA